VATVLTPANAINEIERVLGFVYLNGGPCIALEIAAGIMSNPSRVIKHSKH
jgi:hypothetical protein